MNSPQSPKVVVVQSVEEDIASALRTAHEQVPTLFPVSLPRQVVIKPNLCDITAWETGVTTDPRWLGVLARELRAIRPDVEIRVIESDAISAYKTFRSCDETFDRLGFTTAAREARIDLINLSRADTIEIRLDNIPFPVRIPDLLLEEMFFISIANLKIHPYTRMTGILKNSLGLLSDADISSFHPHLTSLIAGLHMLCPPDLCIIDGRIGLEGQGPILGFPVRMDTLLIGNDALAIDQTACRLMGIPEKEVAHLREVASRLKRPLSVFEIVGDVRPRVFASLPVQSRDAIATKFAVRRFYQRMDALSSRWVDRAIRFRYDPIAFAKATVLKLARRRGAR
jgi:uncharacterized protein (DUF362 family)